MSTMQRSTGTANRESGMVAIMVTLILMIVISLIVLGFADISRRNQRQAIDRQLSTQAFYAAEAGVNDTAAVIRAALASGDPVAAKPDCQSDGGGLYASLNSNLDASGNVAYTCVTVDPTPSSLVYGNVGATGTVIPLNAVGGSIDSITLTWQSKDESATPANDCPANMTDVFSATGAWTCGYGVLRLDIVPTSGSGLSIGGLQSAAMTTFLVPLRPGGSGAAPNPVSYTPASTGTNNKLGVQCTNTSCSQTISGLSGDRFYLRAVSLYKDVSLQVTASSGGNPVNIQSSQAVVDVTGRAGDVLRRIQVRIPLAASSTNLMSDYALQSAEAVCKRFAVMDDFFRNEADNAVPAVTGTTTNPLCQPD